MKDLDKPLEAVAWMYERSDGAIALGRLDEVVTLCGDDWTETPLTDLNKANKIIATLASENAALTEKVERLEKTLIKLRDLDFVTNPARRMQPVQDIASAALKSLGENGKP